MPECTENNESIRFFNNLSVSKRTAITLLCKGLSKSEVARRLNIERGTVSKWCNHNHAFQQALEQKRKEVWGENTSKDEAELIKEVRSADLLTLEGIEARLRLVDSLLLKDIIEHDEGRTKAIQRLQMNVEAARGYTETILAGKSLSDSVAIITNRYKFLLISALHGVLKEAVGEEKEKEVLEVLAQKMERIEGGKDSTHGKDKSTDE